MFLSVKVPLQSHPSVSLRGHGPPEATVSGMVPSQPLPRAPRGPSPPHSPLRGHRPDASSYPWVTVPSLSLSLGHSSLLACVCFTLPSLSPRGPGPTAPPLRQDRKHMLTPGPHQQLTLPEPRLRGSLPGAAPRKREVEEVAGRRPGKAADGTAAGSPAPLPALLSIRPPLLPGNHGPLRSSSASPEAGGG